MADKKTSELEEGSTPPKETATAAASEKPDTPEGQTQAPPPAEPGTEAASKDETEAEAPVPDAADPPAATGETDLPPLSGEVKDTDPQADDAPEAGSGAEETTKSPTPEAAHDGETPASADSSAAPLKAAPMEDPWAKPEPQDTPPADDAVASPAPQPETKVVERVIERKRGGFPALLGGVAAAALGYLAASTDLIEGLMPGAPDTAAEIAALDARIGEQSDRIADVAGRIGGITMPDLAPLDAGIARNAEAVAAVQPALADLVARIDALDQRLTDVEKRPISEGVSEAAIAAYEAELAALQGSVAAQRAEIETMIAEAQAQASQAAQSERGTAARDALTQLRIALDAGAPFQGALAAFRQNAGADVPPALSDWADSGLPTLASLQETFPDAARRALAAARKDDQTAGGVGTFFLRQLGARSVEPRDGDDPDAVLSRMDAAVTAGNIGDALSEFDTLPESAQAELSDWVASARARTGAMQAAADLAQSLNSN
ncbi:MAG: hypothetical protein NXH82_14825 [Rhodobacteraceae bacterium]|nr:hypothetical protein [Paracoccaceae bacterium]